MTTIRLKTRLLVLAAVCLLHTCHALAQSSQSALATELSSFDDWLDNLPAEERFSGALLYANEGRVVYERVSGSRHPVSGGEILPDSSFNLASLSKHFTASGVMMLHQLGLLGYDDSVEEHVPLFPYDQITVRHLLTHTSGLPDYIRLVDRYWHGELLTNEALVRLFHQRNPELVFSPGSRFEYSNTGYVFLAVVIESVSGMSFEQFMYKHFFEPLQLRNAAVFNLLSDPDSLPSRVYGRDGDDLYDLNELDGVTGDGAVYASIRDLLDWHTDLMQGAVFSDAILSEALKPVRLPGGRLSHYGFGWQLFEGQPHLMEHSGSWVGFNNHMIRNTQNGALLVMLSNDSGGVDTDELLSRFLAAVGEDAGF